jgi:hypothetical protein
VAEKKLNLLQIATQVATQLRARPSQIMRRQALDPGRTGVLQNNLPHRRSAQGSLATRPLFFTTRKILFFLISPLVAQASSRSFTHPAIIVQPASENEPLPSSLYHPDNEPRFPAGASFYYGFARSLPLFFSSFSSAQDLASHL